MRILIAVAAAGVLAALVVSATLAITGSDATDQARRGRLEQIREKPLTVRGNGFVAGEKVQVAASTAGAKETRTVRASDSGSFTVSFKLDTCNGVAVSAVGNKGTRTAFQLSQLVCLDG